MDLISQWDAKDVFNMDETALFYSRTPQSGLATHSRSGTKASKARITIAVTANADGTEKAPLLFIGHHGKPRCFRGKSGINLGFRYYATKSAWMTTDVFQKWLIPWNSKLRLQGRHILLLLDNFAGHCQGRLSLSNITIAKFSPGMTSRVQPMDAGIIASLKVNYKRLFLKRALMRMELGQDDLYTMDLLDGIRMVSAAWKAVTKETIVHCWRHAGIMPGVQRMHNSDGSPQDPDQIGRDRDDLRRNYQVLIAGRPSDEVISFDDFIHTDDGSNKTYSEEGMDTPSGYISMAMEDIIRGVRGSEEGSSGEGVAGERAMGSDPEDEDDSTTEEVPMMDTSVVMDLLPSLIEFFRHQPGETMWNTECQLREAMREIMRESRRKGKQASITRYFHHNE